MIGPKIVNRSTQIRNFNTLDPATKAFINALALDGVILTPTQTRALNRLVLNYKGKGNLNNSVNFWNVSTAIYVYISNSATAFKYNLKNPQNTNAAFRLTFSGGFTFNSNGITGNTLNCFANTFLKPSDLAQNSHRVLAYVRTDTGGAAFESNQGATNAGFTNGISFDTRKTTNSHAPYSNTGFSAVTNANRAGLIGINRTNSANFKVFRNGLSLYQVNTASQTPISINFYIGAQNNNGSFLNPTGQNLCFHVFGDSLSDANMLLEYQIIQQYQNDLGRAV